MFPKASGNAYKGEAAGPWVGRGTVVPVVKGFVQTLPKCLVCISGLFPFISFCCMKHSLSGGHAQNNQEVRKQ